MERDMNLVRSILMEAARQERINSRFKIHCDNYSPDVINYHIHIMQQGELLSAIGIPDQANIIPRYTSVYLTWQGHEFLAATRDETRWDSAMAIVQNQGGSVTIGVLIQILSSLMKKSFDLH